MKKGGWEEMKEPGMFREGRLSHSFFQNCDESIGKVRGHQKQHSVVGLRGRELSWLRSDPGGNIQW